MFDNASGYRVEFFDQKGTYSDGINDHGRGCTNTKA